MIKSKNNKLITLIQGESDDCILRLAQKDGIIPNKM